VEDGFWDAWGNWRDVSPETRARVDAAIGDPEQSPLLIVTVGVLHPELVGTLRGDKCEQAVLGAVPDTFPPGYCTLHRPDGSTCRVAVCPASFHVPARGFGVAVQLYAARSDRSWGIGDFTDLAAIVAEVERRGGSTVLTSPLHAPAPGPHPQPSPYSPATREWLSPLHLDVDAVAARYGVDVTDLAFTARRANRGRIIDRDQVWALKRVALERIWEEAHPFADRAFCSWCSKQRGRLARYATWCAIAERYQTPWWEWPPELRHPDSCAVRDEARRHPSRVSFHMWLQWLAETQLRAARRPGVDIVADLAVGFDAGGYDAWLYQDLVCFDFEVGCPPDPRNPDGQRWGLPPFNPRAVAAAGYEPFLAVVRAAFRHGTALRMDHVMGLRRLYWVPAGGSAADGAYVQYPGAELVALLRLEAHLAGAAWVVGEDMGTVEDAVRTEMASSHMLGYRVAEHEDPEAWGEEIMGSVETHDQPTVAGVVTGSDLADLHRIGKPVDDASAAETRVRMAGHAGLDPDGEVTPEAVATAVADMYSWSAGSAARVVLATLDDLAAVPERPNMPNTVDEWPNWRLALPLGHDEVLRGPLADRVFAALAAAGRLRPVASPEVDSLAAG
jgi:4-alpha-glucanotransferase